MKPVNPSLRSLPAHLRKWHADELPEGTWPEGRDLARVHAAGHRLRTPSHGHGGTVSSMQFGPVFTTGPLGWFTGRELETVEKTAEAVRKRNKEKT